MRISALLRIIIMENPDDVDCFQTGALVELFVNKWGEGMRWVNKYDGGPHEANF